MSFHFKPGSELGIETQSEPWVLSDDPYVNLKILANIDDRVLFNLCQTNSYVKSICDGEELWKLKLEPFDFETDRDHMDVYFILANSNSDPEWAINQAVLGGYTDLVIRLLEQNENIRPTKWSLNNAISNGYVDVVEILMNLDPPVLPLISEYHNPVDKAAEKGHLDMLKYLAQLDPPILPRKGVLRKIFEREDWEMLKWLVDQDPEFTPGRGGLNWFIEHGHLDMLKWALELNPEIGPTQEGANNAVRNRDLTALNLLAQLDPPIYPSNYGVGISIDNRYLDVLEFIESVNPESLKVGTEYFIDIIYNENIDILEFLHKHNPDRFINRDYEVNNIAKRGKLKVLKWLAEKGIFPTHEVVLKENSEEISRWLASQDPPIIPEPTRRYWRVNN